MLMSTYSPCLGILNEGDGRGTWENISPSSPFIPSFYSPSKCGEKEENENFLIVLPSLSLHLLP